MFLRRKKPSSAPPMVIRGRRAVTKNLRRTKQGPCWPWAQHDSMSWFDALGENVDDLLPFSGQFVDESFFCATPELVTVAFPEFSSLSVKGIFLVKLVCSFWLNVWHQRWSQIFALHVSYWLAAGGHHHVWWVGYPLNPLLSLTLFESFVLHMSISSKDSVLFMFVQYGWEGWAFVQCVCPWCKSHHGSSDAPVQGYDFLHMFWSIAAKNQIPDGKTRSAAEMSKLLVRMQPKKHSNTSLSQPFHFHALCGIMY